MVSSNPAVTEFVCNILQLIAGVLYQLLPAGTQPTDIAGLGFSVKAIFQAVSHAKIAAVTGQTRRVAAGFMIAEVNIKRRSQGIFPRHIPNIADFQVFSNEKITRINISIVFHREILTAIISQSTNVARTVYEFL